MADTEQLPEDKRCTLFDKPKRFCQRCSEFHAADDWMETCERYVGAAPIRKCKTCGGDHAIDRWPGNCLPEPNWNRSELAAPFVISDNLEGLGGLNGLQSMVDGKYYTSKSRLRAEYRAHDVVEVGNEFVNTPPAERQARPQVDEKALDADIERDIKKTWAQLSTDNFSNDQMANMLRPENAPIDRGFSVE